jgi:hypothetical protein
MTIFAESTLIVFYSQVVCLMHLLFAEKMLKQAFGFPGGGIKTVVGQIVTCIARYLLVFP